jgi:cholesterol oxidase
MQDVDSAIRVKSKRFFFGWRLTSENDAQRPNATYIPAANETARRIAKRYGGIAGGHIGDLVNAPFTAHFVGGCVIGKIRKRELSILIIESGITPRSMSLMAPPSPQILV